MDYFDYLHNLYKHDIHKTPSRNNYNQLFKVVGYVLIVLLFVSTSLAYFQFLTTQHNRVTEKQELEDTKKSVSLSVVDHDPKYEKYYVNRATFIDAQSVVFQDPITSKDIEIMMNLYRVKIGDKEFDILLDKFGHWSVH